MESLWWRRALDQRLGTLTGAAIVLWTIGTAIAASMATSAIGDAIVAERQTRAQAIAARLDRTLEDAFRQLDLIAAASAGQVAAQQATPARVDESGWRAMRWPIPQH